MIKKSNAILLLLALYYFIYLYCTILNLNLLGNILSPIGPFFAFIFIFKYINGIPWSIIKIFGLSLSIGCLFYALAEVLWGIFDYANLVDPGSSLTITLIYTVTNLLFFIAVMLYIVEKFKKWNKFQLTIDFLISCISVLYLLWALFLNRDIQTIQLVLDFGLISLINIILDILIFTIITIWYLSIRGGKIPLSIRLMTTGTVLYSITDIVWYYLEFHSRYIPNTLIDSFYILSMVLIAGAFVINSDKQLQNEFYRYDYSNVGMNNKVFLFLPILILLIHEDGFITSDVLFFSVSIFVYKSTSNYIQLAIQNEFLLEKETNLNAELELRIKERTKELTDKNLLLHNMSNKNMLTDLYNRRYFKNKAEEIISNLPSFSNIVALFIDLNKFKSINDQHGHKTGDQVLVEVSKRLSQVRYNDSTLCHFGGDEFVIVCEVGILNMNDIHTFAEQIIASIAEPIQIDNFSFNISMSIGISFGHCNTNIDDLINNADFAMYEAKEQGQNKFVIYDNDMSKKIRRKNDIMYLLSNMDYENEFQLVFQPQLNIVENKLIGMEALIRWNNPLRGSISPVEFIPIAEEINQIISIGKFVLINALKQISLWNNKYQLQLVMGINISPKQLMDDNFVPMIEQLFHEYDINPKWIDLEITEGIAMVHNEDTYAALQELKNMGVSISFDDFGTGFSSFSTYKYFPFDRIKIAKQFIDNIHQDENAYNITKFFLLLSESLDNRLIVEGVESKEQYDVLVELGCEEIQGYYISKPLPSNEFEDQFLKKK
ncbi:EAL domain-containing protein [Alkalibaculum sp. M08DMB]|uniref:EAL domain-containing protein n=1 Tax=Alkalibaculum sporogenes TaxID=2655001 RepID=A0A6A7KAE6_9FIRM|nr:EAL domain-containing protein [Alkalibaculum sporogenes]MPW26157.1 EAL domain-containing protein [Alkalibaculum sporogenes]